MAKRAKGSYVSTIQVVKITWIDPSEGTCIEWVKGADEAEIRRIEIKATYTRGKVPMVYVKTVKVPVAPKAALLTWLNTNLTRDNG